MNPREFQAALDERAAAIRAAFDAGDPASLVRAAKQVATIVREQAGRNGHVIGVRVVERPAGVRITVTGRQATRYKTMIEDGLKRVLPQAASEIADQITARIR